MPNYGFPKHILRIGWNANLKKISYIAKLNLKIVSLGLF